MANRYAAASAVQTAEGFVSGEICLIECSVRMASLAHSLVPDWTKDPDFIFFGVLASDTDHLPNGSARQHWSAAALAQADKEIVQINESSREEALRACNHIIERFKNA